jgi:sugar phosphate permease
VAVSGFVMVTATVPLFHAMSVWAVALEHQFGWNRTQLGLALAFTRIEGGLLGPAEGYLTDRAGTRRMVLFGLLIFGAGFLLFGQVRNLWMFYLAYLVMALGQGLGSWIPLMTMLNHWFIRRRATAMGWANVGSRGGALLLVPAIAWAIDPDHERLGWRVTATAVGVFAVLVAFPISRLIRNRPQDYNLHPDGTPPAAPPAPAAAPAGAGGGGAAQTAGGDLTASQALRTPAFWLISFGHGFTSMVIIAIMAHLGLLIEDKGFSVQTTGWIVAAYTAVSMVFQLVGGYVGDRMPKRVALCIFTVVQAIAVVVLTFADSLATFYLFAVLFGMGFGGRNPLTVAIRGDYFGRASFGKILGLSTVPMNVLLMIASPFAGYVRDVRGTYTVAFLVLAALNLLGALLFLLAKRPSPGPALRQPEAGQGSLPGVSGGTTRQ